MLAPDDRALDREAHKRRNDIERPFALAPMISVGPELTLGVSEKDSAFDSAFDSAVDVVAAADLAVEVAITGVVRATWPGTVVAAEESAAAGDVLRDHRGGDAAGAWQHHPASSGSAPAMGGRIVCGASLSRISSPIRSTVWTPHSSAMRSSAEMSKLTHELW